MGSQIIETTFLFKRGTTDRWNQVNPVLKEGEPGFEIDVGRLKIGDGKKHWKDLPYIDDTSYSLSPDGNSLILNKDKKLMLYGFEDAQINYTPVKGENGKLQWVRLHSIATSGDITDLIQTKEFTLYGGSASLQEEFVRNGFNVTLRLRRDNDYNYAKIKDTFIPAKGELCLVDTAKDGLQVICGDGITTFGKLEYVNTILVRGYLIDGQFYKDKTATTLLSASSVKLYLDLLSNSLYLYDGNDYILIAGNNIARANAETPGIMKLYDSTGNNTDGTMTQAAITDELDDKVEIKLNMDEELLIFTY